MAARGRWALGRRRGCAMSPRRCSRPTSGRRWTGRASSPPTSRSCWRSVPAAAGGARAARADLPPRDGPRAVAGAADRHGRRAGGAARARPGPARVAGRRARARAHGGRRSCATTRYVRVPRATGPPRVIERPKARLKEIQRWILRELLAWIPVHDAAHGFVRGRSARTHASAHLGRRVVDAASISRTSSRRCPPRGCTGSSAPPAIRRRSRTR